MARYPLRTIFPPGHFYSPIVDPDSVKEYHQRSLQLKPSELEGIAISPEGMLEFWRAEIEIIKATSFPKQKEDSKRYHSEGGPFPYGDALVLRAMIAHFKPKRIIEIGSGFSTACMLDAADEFGRQDLNITCIEPDPDRPNVRVWPRDLSRLTVIRDLVQNVPLSTFYSLEENDILFIDSTHVLKTGSDVHYELFQILPGLKPGVLVHFHDCMYPFEYPAKWVFQRNYSWNEIYALRAFLMYNDRFRIFFWNSFFRRKFKTEIAEKFPNLLAENPGSSIWLRVYASADPHGLAPYSAENL